MGEAKIWRILSKNLAFNPYLRYIVIEFEQNHYLVDNNYAWWGYISPIFTWIIPEKVMKINLSKEEVDALLLDREGQEKSGESNTSARGIGVFISVVLGPLLFPMADHFFGFYIPISINMLISLAIITAMVVLKSRLSKSAVQIMDFIGTENLSEIRIAIVPLSVWQALKILASRMVFSMMLLGLFMFIFAESNEMNVMGWLAGLFGLSGVLYQNFLLRTFARYKIKIFD